MRSDFKSFQNLWFYTLCNKKVYVFTKPFYHKQDVTQSQYFFQQSLTGLNLEFSFL